VDNLDVDVTLEIPDYTISDVMNMTPAPIPVTGKKKGSMLTLPTLGSGAANTAGSATLDKNAELW
jgi:hypothetical protein